MIPNLMKYIRFFIRFQLNLIVLQKVILLMYKDNADW